MAFQCLHYGIMFMMIAVGLEIQGEFIIQEDNIWQTIDQWTPDPCTPSIYYPLHVSAIRGTNMHPDHLTSVMLCTRLHP